MNKGAACAKGLAGIQALYNPNRIKYPMKRIGERGSNEWERISWEQAINEIADVMWEYYQKEGPKSLVCSTGGGGNPQFFSPARAASGVRRGSMTTVFMPALRRSVTTRPVEPMPW